MLQRSIDVSLGGSLPPPLVAGRARSRTPEEGATVPPPSVSPRVRRWFVERRSGNVSAPIINSTSE